MSIFALTIILGESLQKLFHLRIPDAVDSAISAIMLIFGLLAFIFALRFRLRKRLLPRGFVVIEAVLGIAGALCLFVFYGVTMHFIID